MGDKEYNLEVWTDEGVFPVDVHINEKVYTQEELESVFLQGKEWLDNVWLGNNETSDNVSENLYFPAYIEALGLSVHWEIGNYEWIQSDGTITETAYREAPCSTKVCAVLTYDHYESSQTYEVTIVKPDSEQTVGNALKDEIDRLSQVDLTKDVVELPEKIQGDSLVWYKRKSSEWQKVFLFGNIIVVLIYFTKEEKRIQRLEDRNKALNKDYPDIVYRLILLIGAGMTVKNAWEKVVKDYERKKETTGKEQLGYEEMAMTLREMNYGIAEIKAYENFGNRCGSQNYMRLSALLIQQVKRGAKGMNQLLMQEVTEADIIWRENGRKRAEEAGIKLLVPMVLLMTVVFAVLMIPAFLSMGV